MMDHWPLVIRLKLSAAAVLLVGGGIAALATAPADPARAAAVTCLAQAVYFEARGEPLAGQFAVAAVVMNRVADRRYPDRVCDVVFQGEHRRHACQFSFACDGLSDRATPGRSWRRALHVAEQSLAGFRPDLTGRATHYHADTVNPDWADALQHTVAIGGHRFYRDGRVAMANR